MGALSEIHRAGSDTIQSNSDIPAALPTPLIRSIGAQSGTLRLSARLSQGSEGAFLNKNVRRHPLDLHVLQPISPARPEHSLEAHSHNEAWHFVVLP